MLAACKNKKIIDYGIEVPVAPTGKIEDMEINVAEIIKGGKPKKDKKEAKKWL